MDQTKTEEEKQIRAIAEYLGCNAGELWSEMSNLLSLHDKKLAETIRSKRTTGYAPGGIDRFNDGLELAAQVIEGKEGV